MVQDVSSWQLTENGKGHTPVGNQENLAKRLSEEAWGLKILLPPIATWGAVTTPEGARARPLLDPEEGGRKEQPSRSLS